MELLRRIRREKGKIESLRIVPKHGECNFGDGVQENKIVSQKARCPAGGFSVKASSFLDPFMRVGMRVSRRLEVSVRNGEGRFKCTLICLSMRQALEKG